MSKPMEKMNDDAAHAAGEPASWSLHVDEHGHSGAYEPNSVELGIVGVAWVVLIVSLAMTFRYLFRPGEKGADHIKRRILHDGGLR